jgi:hypothetical protein
MDAEPPIVDRMNELWEQMRAPFDARNMQGWQHYLAALREWSALGRERILQIGNMCVCREGGRFVKTIPIGHVERGLREDKWINDGVRVLGCEIKDRCDCQRRWDDLWHQVYRGERDERVRTALWRIFATDGDAATAACQLIVEAGYSEEAAGVIVHRFINEADRA